MNKIISLILLAAGITLMVYGVHATNSLGSDFSRFFTGSPTQKSIWLLMGGIVLVAAGAGGVARGSNSS